VIFYPENFLYFSQCGMTLPIPRRRFVVFLVIGEIAFEPFDMAVAFEGEHMRRDAIQKRASGRTVPPVFAVSRNISTESR
jgi:hypothetical protein